jgi:hypothetical protein
LKWISPQFGITASIALRADFGKPEETLDFHWAGGKAASPMEQDSHFLVAAGEKALV